MRMPRCVSIRPIPPTKGRYFNDRLGYCSMTASLKLASRFVRAAYGGFPPFVSTREG